jgi:hypothetical protein
LKRGEKCPDLRPLHTDKPFHHYPTQLNIKHNDYWQSGGNKKSAVLACFMKNTARRAKFNAI